MLIFIDESGDTGRRTSQGSSLFFTISLVIFDDNEEATACDERISLLRRELRQEADYEYHFSHNSKKVRLEFLKAVQPYRFVYTCISVNKDPDKLYGEGFNNKNSFYKYVCQLAFLNAKQFVYDAVVILDKSGLPDFRNQLSKYLRARMNDTESGIKIIKKLKQQESHRNNLLQVADYVSGIVNRKVQKKSDWQEYYKYISSKEMSSQIWPK